MTLAGVAATAVPMGEAVRTADAAGRAAAERAGVSVLELSTPAETERAAEVLREVWRGPEAPVPANLIRTVQHTGGYAFGAYDASSALVAVSLGLLASVDGERALHSHITGVVPAGQRRGLGLALKQHQRRWALERGLTTVTWTCDPLVRRNVTFNLHGLGARVVHYLPDHYGAMTDGVNKGDESDRFELHWDLLSPAAVSAGEHRLPHLPPGDLPYAVAQGDAGLPVVASVPAGSFLVQLPADIEALRRVDPAAGLSWRHAVRGALLPALSAGATIRGLTADGALVLEVSS